MAMLGQTSPTCMKHGRAIHQARACLKNARSVCGLCSSSTGVLLIKHGRASRTSFVFRNDFELKPGQFSSKLRANTYIRYCLHLPPFGLLPFLKELSIEGLDKIVRIGAEFYGTSSSPFPCLETMSFKNMEEWEEWECKVSFPRLHSLSIWRCPKLKEVSEQLFHVKKLKIKECGIEASWFERNGHAVSNTSLEELEISGSFDSLTTFSLDLFPKLRLADLWNCRNLRMITQEHTPNHLERLKICRSPQFESFPKEGLSAPRLETFEISELEKLKSLPKHMHVLLPSLTVLVMCDCPEVEMLSEGGLPSNLKLVSLSSMKLIGSLKGALGPNTCLHTLWIYNNADVECFPEEGLLPLSLTTLFIGYCRNIKKLDYKGLCNLSSLQSLQLCHCPNLECLPEEGLPKSISTLKILGCPLLNQRCQKPEGEDWAKIAHIQNLTIY